MANSCAIVKRLCAAHDEICERMRDLQPLLCGNDYKCLLSGGGVPAHLQER